MAPIPDHYKPGSQLSIILEVKEEKFTVAVTVIDVFIPFSFGQVLVIKLDDPIPVLHLSSGQLLVLKVYDPRYLKDREDPTIHPKRPWSYSAELQAAKARPQGYVPEVVAEHNAPEEDDLAGMEKYYFDREGSTYNRELAAYAKLGPLQGTGVPRFFAPGTLIPPEPRAIDIQILLLEYIPDAKNLKDVDAHLITIPLIKSLLQTVGSFASLGVTHGDLNQGNILFSPGTNPIRVVVIDFGGSWARDEGDSDEDWRGIVHWESDAHNMARILDFSLKRVDRRLEDCIETTYKRSPMMK